MATGNIRESLNEVLIKIKLACERRPQELANRYVRLVAVSKTKPKDQVIQAYEFGQKHFGENYVNELHTKSNDPEILEKCPEIKWHFIGRISRSQVNKLLGVKNLHVLETIDSLHIADVINGSLERYHGDRTLNAMIQVNTSGEEGKNGIHPEKTSELFLHIKEKCPRLKVVGLMTIGSLQHSLETMPNPDFRKLLDCKNNLSEQFKLDPEGFELSMGMSHDFEHAIELGSTSVRVGSLIFGARNLQK